jgi:hypothetical protein
MLGLFLLSPCISEKPQGPVFPFGIWIKCCGTSYYEKSEMALRLCAGSLCGMMHRHLVTFLPHSESTIIQQLNQEDRRGVRGGALRGGRGKNLCRIREQDQQWLLAN